MVTTKCECTGCNKPAKIAVYAAGKHFLRCKKHAEEFINHNMMVHGGTYPTTPIK